MFTFISLGVMQLKRQHTNCIYRKYAQGGQFTKDIRIDGKVVIITGCNTGIGKETAIDLAKRGARVYMACRNFDRCETARREIIELSRNKNVFNLALDLTSFESIRNFVKELVYHVNMRINETDRVINFRNVDLDIKKNRWIF